MSDDELRTQILALFGDMNHLQLFQVASYLADTRRGVPLMADLAAAAGVALIDAADGNVSEAARRAGVRRQRLQQAAARHATNAQPQ